MVAGGSTHVVDDLARMLFALDEGMLSTAEVTALITTKIARWALSKGWSVHREARVQMRSDSDARIGFVDVFVNRGGAEPDLAIEIDSTDKAWSLTKLRHAASAGMRAVWIRWGDEGWAGVHDDIDVIQLPARRRTAHRAHAINQLTLWS